MYSVDSKYSVDEICNYVIELLRKNNIKQSCYIRPLLFTAWN